MIRKPPTRLRDPLDELGKIERSLRFRASASAYLTRLFVAPTNNRKWTINVWCKRSELGAVLGAIMAAGSTGADYTVFRFQSDAFLFTEAVANVVQWTLTTTALSRDPGGHMNVNFQFDSANATATDRCIIRIDSGEALVYSGSVSLNSGSYINSAVSNHIGLFAGGGQNFGGYMSQFCFVDGKSLGPETFGQFHPRTGQWRPKTKSAIRAAVAAGGGTRNGWGANGFFLPFDDATSLTTLGYDRSQSDTDTTGNNWTATNISLTAGVTYDSMLDTPTNNFATLNPLVPTGGTCSDGNLKITTAANGGCYSSIPVTKGAVYAEATITSVGTDVAIGIKQNFSGGLFASGVGYYSTSGNKYVNGAISAYGATFTTNDVIGVLVDYDSQTVRFFKNATAYSTIPLPVANADWYFVAWNGSSAANVVNWNFGQRPFAYPANQGTAKTLCTKNLPFKPAGPMKSTDAFVAKTNSGANIVSDIAAATPWSDWIRIYKRRDASEGWRWQFSDDSANYLDSSSAAAKAAFPALTGSSYVGYALKVSAQNGVATGRLVHTNGVADTLVDGLANSRKAIILVNEAGSNWYFYHPDLTAGKLLYLNSTAAETADATIGSVTASGFTVAAALASGTYRWIAIAETDGFFKLFKHQGNASTDGPFDALGLSANLIAAKIASASGADWVVLDQARNQYNVMNTVVRFNTTAADDSSNPRLDADSNGIKMRGGAGVEPNTSGSYVGFAFAAFPFRYANAR